MSLAAVIERSRDARESWKYTDIEAQLKADFSLETEGPSRAMAALPTIGDANAQRHQIVFNGAVWQKEKSLLGGLPSDIMTGNAAEGYRLTLAEQTCLITSPVELVFLPPEDGDSECSMMLHIDIGESGRLTLIEHHLYNRERSGARIIDTEINLGAQAKLVHGKIVHGHGVAVHITTTRVNVAKGAYYDNFKLIKGGRLIRNEMDVKLAGKLAQCNLNGIMLLRGHQHADTATRITHAAPEASSSEYYKSVVDGKARGVFQGKILVEKNAQKTDGKQLSRALLLSDQAEMDAKPELEIYADDVKCSHGSTIGDLDPDMMFYLQSRGLPEAEARAFLIRGFLTEAVELIQVPEWQAFCRSAVEEWLHEQA